MESQHTWYQKKKRASWIGKRHLTAEMAFVKQNSVAEEKIQQCVQTREQSTESEKYYISYCHDNIEGSEDNWPATIFREDERKWQKQSSLSFHAISALLLHISPLSTKTRIGICSRVAMFLFQLLAVILPEIFFQYVKGLPIRDRIVKRRATNLLQYH